MLRCAGKWEGAWVVLAASFVMLWGCENSEPSPAPPIRSAAPVAAAFDIEGFCETVMAVGRECEGDDELMEGNKIGLCAATLRAARDDDGVRLDEAASKLCLADAKLAEPPLPDVRTLTTLAQRFESCRAFTRTVPSLSKLTGVSVGVAKEAQACRKHTDCAHGLHCPRTRAGTIRVCARKKKAGEACVGNVSCIGRCSRKDGNKCVAYCGSG